MTENPFAPPQETSRNFPSEQRRSFWQKSQVAMAHCAVGIVTSSIVAVAGHFISDQMGEEQFGYLLLAMGALLLTVLVFHARRAHRFTELLAGACGLTWGFLGTLTFIITTENGSLWTGRPSVNWPTMIPTLVFGPWIASLLVLPFRRSPPFPRNQE